MTTDDLKQLPFGTKLLYIFGEGSAAKRIRAEVRTRGSGYVGVLVYFQDEHPDKKQQLVRWSLATNQPIRESRGYIGKVRLERLPSL